MLTRGICCIHTVFTFRVSDHVQVRGMAGNVGNGPLLLIEDSNTA